MKKIALVVIAVLLIALGIIGCAPSKSESDRYTQSQVISIVRGASFFFSGETITGKPSKLWSAEYDGDGFWFVTTGTEDPYDPSVYQGDITPRKYWVWWFNERTGEVSRHWIVTPQELVDRRGGLPSYDKGSLPRWD